MNVCVRFNDDFSTGVQVRCVICAFYGRFDWFSENSNKRIVHQIGATFNVLTMSANKRKRKANWSNNVV